MSPAKPALKMSSSPDRRLYTGLRTGQTPSEISDATSVASDDGSRTGSRKKAVKVSFDDGPDIVGVAASPPTSPEPVDTPSPIEKTKSRSWFSIAKKKLSLKDANDDDFESVLKPRPALPSFGSIRGTRELDEPSTSVVNDDNDSTSSSDDELDHFSASNDHAIGGILANAYSQKEESIAQDRETTAQNTGSETRDTVLEDIDEIPSVSMQQQLPTVVEESDSSPSPLATPVQTPTVALDGPLLGTSVDGSLEAVPTIAIQPATPGEDNRRSLELQNMPGGFPMSSERNTTSKVESTPASAVAAQTEPSTPANDAPTTVDDDDGESDESVYSDAAEDPDGFDGDGFGSIDAIVDSPMPSKTEPQQQAPESPNPSRVSPVTAVAVSPPQSPSTSQAMAPEPSIKSSVVESQSPSTPKATSPTESAEPVKQRKDTTSVNASGTAGKQKSIDSFDPSWPLRSKDDPSPSVSAQTKTKRPVSGDPHQGSHLRKALGKNERQRANPQNRHSTPVMPPVPISQRTSSPPLPNSATLKKQSSNKPTQKPMPLAGILVSANGDDSDSDSSFKRTRRSSRAEGQYSMKRTMRATRPVSMATAETTVGRSTSPRASSMRMTMRGPPAERPSSGFASLRNKTASPRMRTSTTAPSLRSRIIDSDDEGDSGRNIFRSRFADSSDEDEPFSSNLTPVRGIPRRRGELDRESTDLEDSSDEEGKRAARNGTIRPGSQMTPAEIDAILSQPRKRGGLLSRFTSKGKDGKVRKSDLESAARRDTPLERTPMELAQVREEAGIPRADRSTTPKLHKKSTTAQGSTWPTASPPPSKEIPNRPSTSEGLVNGVDGTAIERPTYIRKSTLDSLESEPVGAVSDVVVGRTGRKKRFPLLRKAFGLRD
jgi:hypothetical protein